SFTIPGLYTGKPDQPDRHIVGGASCSGESWAGGLCSPSPCPWQPSSCGRSANRSSVDADRPKRRACSAEGHPLWIFLVGAIGARRSPPASDFVGRRSAAGRVLPAAPLVRA